jgi:hypothetical protein
MIGPVLISPPFAVLISMYDGHPLDAQADVTMTGCFVSDKSLPV